jgi:hypothetical protein
MHLENMCYQFGVNFSLLTLNEDCLLTFLCQKVLMLVVEIFGNIRSK